MLKDAQSEIDDREIAIEQVGGTALRYPVTVLDRVDVEQQTIADITLSTGLPHDTKGIDVSRFIEVLEQHRGELTVRTIPDLLLDVKKRLDAESARTTTGCRRLPDKDLQPIIVELNGYLIA